MARYLGSILERLARTRWQTWRSGRPRAASRPRPAWETLKNLLLRHEGLILGGVVILPLGALALKVYCVERMEDLLRWVYERNVGGTAPLSTRASH